VIARILGHADIKTTQRYAHLADAPVRRTAE
jgi:site-specific recombinase XerD